MIKGDHYDGADVNGRKKIQFFPHRFSKNSRFFFLHHFSKNIRILFSTVFQKQQNSFFKYCVAYFCAKWLSVSLYHFQGTLII